MHSLETQKIKKIYIKILHGRELVIQGVIKGTDTFQSFIFKKLDNL